MKKLIALSLIVILASCSLTESGEGKTAPEWCFEDISRQLEESHREPEELVWTCDDFEPKESRGNYLITLYYIISGSRKVIDYWACFIDWEGGERFSKTAIKEIDCDLFWRVWGN